MLIMRSARAHTLKNLHNLKCFSSTDKRESLPLHPPLTNRFVRSGEFGERLLQIEPDRNSIVLDIQNNLGTEYGFITCGPPALTDEDYGDNLLTLADLLNEVATVDQTLENNLLFTQHIHEDNELFGVLYAHEDFYTFAASLFGDLGNMFNPQQLIEAQEQVDESQSNYTNSFAFHNDHYDSRFDNRDDRIEESSNSMSDWEEAGRTARNNGNHIPGQEISKGIFTTETTDQTLISSHNQMMIAPDTNYVFTDNEAQADPDGSEYLGRKRNLE